MQLVAEKYNDSSFDEDIAFYLEQIYHAQLDAPFTDGQGLVAATLQDGNHLPPYEQCLSTPFQCFPERVGLAGTTWAIFADQAVNPMLCLCDRPMTERARKTEHVRVEHSAHCLCGRRQGCSVGFTSRLTGAV